MANARMVFATIHTVDLLVTLYSNTVATRRSLLLRGIIRVIRYYVNNPCPPRFWTL